MNSADSLTKRALLTPNREAMIELASGVHYTYAELNQRANRAANFLRGKYGIGKGDRVSILAHWDDNPEKLERFQRILDQSDYLFITSNRQWGSLPRLAERFPLVTTYYRHLLGCPPEQDIVWCYTVAEPGMFMGDLGFELAEVFESPPTLGLPRPNITWDS